MKNILVTGGAGNIGGALVEALLKDPGYKVTVVDNLVTGSLDKLPTQAKRNLRFIKADVNHYDEIAVVMLGTRFDVVFHYAALVGVKRTLENPLLVLKDIEGIKNILRLAKDTGVDRVFYSSSSEVYGEAVAFPQNEVTTPLNSRLPYAIVKNVGEAFFRTFHQEYGLSYTVFRFFNTYGPRQSTDFVIMRFINAALKGADLIVHGTGEQTRTFCHIDDNVATTLGILKKDLFRNSTVNVGSDVEYSILDVARMVKQITKSPSKIVHVEARKEGDMSRRQPDISRMKSVLGRPLVPLETGIRKILKEKLKPKAGPVK